MQLSAAGISISCRYDGPAALFVHSQPELVVLILHIRLPGSAFVVLRRMETACDLHDLDIISATLKGVDPVEVFLDIGELVVTGVGQFVKLAAFP